MTRANPKRELSKTALKNLQTLYNHLTDGREKMSADLKWVYANHKALYDICKSDSFTIKTQKSYLSALISALYHLKKDYLASQYEKNREDLQKRIDYDYGENEQPRIGTFDDLVAKRNELAKNRNKSLKDNYLHIITSLYTYQAPLRKEWRQVQFETTKPFEKFKRSIKQQKQHFLFWNKNGDLVIALGEYKAHPPINITLSKTLQDIIVNSFEKFPRKWLFADYRNQSQPLSNPEHVKLLKEIDLGDESNYRAIYYSHMMAKQPNMTQNKKTEIADLMRTSVPMLDKVYRKVQTAVAVPVNETETRAIDTSQLQKMMTDIVDERLKRTIELPTCYEPETETTEKPKTGTVNYAKTYRKKHDDRVRASSMKYYSANLLKARAKRYCHKLNLPKDHKNHIKNPSENKLTEYNIVKQGDRWIIQ